MERVPLDRRMCYIEQGRLDIRPSPLAVVGPILILLLGVGLLIALAFLMNRLPAAGAALMLLVAMVAVAFGGLGTVHSLMGSYLLVEAEKQSVRFQQGLLGLGLGTRELVPFWKIDHIELADGDLGEGRGPAFPLDMRAWEVVLVKTNGKRLTIGQVTVPQVEELVDEGFSRAYRVAEAVAHLTGRPLVITAALEPETTLEPEEEKAGKEAW